MKTAAIIGLAALMALSCAWSHAGGQTSTDLFNSIRAGDRAAVAALLKGGADVHARDNLGNTPLIAASLYAGTDVIELLIKAGADVNAANNAGVTALMRAATFEDKVRALLQHGADVKARSEKGNTALILAARIPGSASTVRLLLDRGADVNATNGLGATALMAAAAAPDLDTARALLDRGADVNAKPTMDTGGFIFGGGRSALMWAAFQGNEPMIKLLLQRGAKVNDFTPVGTALIQAAWGDRPGAARLLLDAGAAVNQRDLIANYTALHWAASSEHSATALVDLLLKRGADVNAEGGQPVDNLLGVIQTPLSLARKRGDTAIARALLKAGARDSAPAAPAPKKALAGDPTERTAASAVQRALPQLTQTAENSVATFAKHASKQNCISCHQQQLPLAAMSIAGARGFSVDRSAIRHQIELLKQMIGDPEEAMQATFVPEAAIFAGYAAMNLRLEGEPGSMTVTDPFAHLLATLQHPDGHWSWNIPRPPIQASEIGATAQAVQTLKFYPIPARKRELERRIERARQWLAAARAESNEERIHQILGLAWAGESGSVVKRLARELAREQRADGGWGQLAGLESDAYATGQALYALLEGAKFAPTDPVIRRGVDYLLKAQLADGTWHVRRRAHPFQPPMDSGFPHGADGWISSAGTGWAVMALALTVDPSQAKSLSPLAKANSAGRAAMLTDRGTITTPVDFERDIRPVLERSCVGCHSGERPKGGFTMANRADFFKGGNRNERVVVAGHSEQSGVVRLVCDQVEDLEMPPLGKREKFPALTKDEISRLRAWIDQGAVWPEQVVLNQLGK